MPGGVGPLRAIGRWIYARRNSYVVDGIAPEPKILRSRAKTHHVKFVEAKLVPFAIKRLGVGSRIEGGPDETRAKVSRRHFHIRTPPHVLPTATEVPSRKHELKGKRGEGMGTERPHPTPSSVPVAVAVAVAVGGIVVESRTDATEAIIDEGKSPTISSAQPEDWNGDGVEGKMRRVVADDDDEEEEAKEEEEEEEEDGRPLLLPSALRSSSLSATRACNPHQVLFGTSAGQGSGSSGKCKKPNLISSMLPFRNHSNGEGSDLRNGRRRGIGGRDSGWSFGAGDDGDEDDDPVMALFRARANHRVRFSLEQQPPRPEKETRARRTKAGGTRPGPTRRGLPGKERSRDDHARDGEAPSSSSSTRSLKRFVKSALFGGGLARQSSGSNPASLAKWDARVAKIQDEEDDDDSFDFHDEEEGDAGLLGADGSISAVGSLSSAQTNQALLSTPSPPRAKSERDGQIAAATQESESSPQTKQTSPSRSQALPSSPKTPRRTVIWGQSSSPFRKIKTARTTDTAAFAEQAQVRSQVNVLLNKANRAHHVHFRYEYTIKCCMKALDLLKRTNYPEDHPAVLKTIQYLNTAHHALSSLENSANIVKMGIKYEDGGDLVRALKMYTIAYRIRRDNLSRSHPSLIVLLNMLGSIQVKRDELEEAMEIFELALKDDPRLMGDDHGGDGKDRRGDDDLADHSDHGSHMHEHKEADQSPLQRRSRSWRDGRANNGSATNNALARSVAYREMGIIYERWGEVEEALHMYHRSLNCIAEYKGIMWEPPSLSTNHRLASMPLHSHKLDLDATPSHVGAVPLVSPSPEGAGTSTSGSSPPGPTSIGSPASSPNRSVSMTESTPDDYDDDVNNTTISSCPVSVATEQDILLDLESVQLSRSFVRHATVVKSHKEDDGQFESGMELFLSGYGGASTGGNQRLGSRAVSCSPPMTTSSCYDVFFPDNDEDLDGTSGRHLQGSRKKSRRKDASTASVDMALTLHQIGQLYRAEGEYDWALAAYAVSLRGMKRELGTNHPNVAAILGNLGNVQKEMGDLTSAYETYQQVLAIESYRLGLSHPDVAITLHNIATIDAARGNHQNALTLYDQVLSLQRKLFGDGHMSLAVTATCMGDVYERIGDVENAIEAFDEALRIKSSVQGRHSVEVARLLHKLGKLSAQNGDVQLADSYLSRTVLIYRLNKIQDDDPWMIEVNRDVADIDALIAMGRAEDMFEC